MWAGWGLQEEGPLTRRTRRGARPPGARQAGSARPAPEVGGCRGCRWRGLQGVSGGRGRRGPLSPLTGVRLMAALRGGRRRRLSGGPRPAPAGWRRLPCGQPAFHPQQPLITRRSRALPGSPTTCYHMFSPIDIRAGRGRRLINDTGWRHAHHGRYKTDINTGSLSEQLTTTRRVERGETAPSQRHSIIPGLE